jgi:hypothetical protein
MGNLASRRAFWSSAVSGRSTQSKSRFRLNSNGPSCKQPGDARSPSNDPILVAAMLCRDKLCMYRIALLA